MGTVMAKVIRGNSLMTSSRIFLWAATCAGVLFSLSAAVAVPWKNESGHGKYQGGNRHGKVPHEHKSDDRKYENKGGPRGYKEERKCDVSARRGGPPPWAPAHGHRAKQGGRHGQSDDWGDHRLRDGDDHVGYDTVTRDLGILEGACRREEIGAALGGVVGGVIGSKVGKGDERKVATIASAVLGALVGSQIGRHMDQTNQQCTGQILERAPDRQAVTSRNPDTGVQYRVTPTKTFRQQAHYCREYIAEATIGGTATRVRGNACRKPDGSWQTVQGS